MTPLEWKTEKRKVKDLIPLSYNPRTITPEKRKKLEASLEKFNLVEIPVINLDGTLIAGNQRVTLLMDLKHGDREIDVRVPNRELTEQEVKEYNITSNTHVGIWDVAVLEEVFANDIDLGDFDMPDNVMKELDQLTAPEAEEDDYQAPDDLKVDVVKGDLIVFKKGDLEHRLLCGDSTNADDVEKVLNDNTPYLMITDPPYGVEYDPKWRDEAERANGKSIGARALGQVQNDGNADWTNSWAISPSIVAYVYHAGKYSSIVQESLVRCNFIIRNQIIWAKNNFAISRGNYHWKHEPCWYAVKKGKKAQWVGGHSQTTVWNIDKPMKSETGHGTQKPIECMSTPIKNHERNVYDPFTGSGTTMVAAHQLSRNFYGLEITEKYCQVIINRMHLLDPEIQITINGKAYTPNE